MNEGVTEGRTEGRKDGTYSAGLKDSASAYVLCPRLTEQLCLSIWEGVGNTERDLEGFQERWESEGVWKDGNVRIKHKLVYKLTRKLTTRACRNLYISEQ